MGPLFVFLPHIFWSRWHIFGEYIPQNRRFCSFFLQFCLAEDNLLARRMINTFLVSSISSFWGGYKSFFLDELMRFRVSSKRYSALWDFCTLRFLLFFFFSFFFLNYFFFLFNLQSSSAYIPYLWILPPSNPILFLYILFQIVNLLSCLSVPILCPFQFSQPQAFSCHSIRGKMLPTNLSDYIELHFRIQTWAWAFLAVFSLCWRAETSEATVLNPGYLLNCSSQHHLKHRCRKWHCRKCQGYRVLV